MKRIFSIVMVLVLVIGLGTVVLPAGSASATVEYDVPGDFDTIQEAIDAALEAGGGTIYVATGVYQEDLLILGTLELPEVGKVKELNIIGSGASLDDLAIMQGGGEGVEGSGVKGGILIYNVDYPLQVQGFTIYNTGGSGMRILDSGVYTSIHDCVMSGVGAENGGGMYIRNSSPGVTNCSFSGCDVSKYGGGMYNDNSSPIVLDGYFVGNQALCGGGMYNYNSSPVVTNCFFDETNMAYSDGEFDARGGAICNINSPGIFTGCELARGYAKSLNSDAYGGVMYNYNSSPTVTDCNFRGSGKAYSEYGNAYGGGMCNINSSPEINNCVFTGVHTFSDYGNSYGGGMYNDNSSPSLTDCTFFTGPVVAEDFGGGMYNKDSSPVLTNCSISGYTSGVSGGGIYSEGGTLTLDYCTVDNCKAGTSGGGIYILNAPITVTNTVIDNNQAVRFGGGVNIYFSDVTDGQAVVKNSIISNNSITSEADLYNGGGGIAMAGRGGYGWGTLTVVNSIIHGNTVATASSPELAAGGGIRVGGSNYNKLNIFNSTIVNNTAATMGGIRGGPTTMANSILWGNTAPKSPQLPPDKPVTYSDIQGGYPGTGNIDKDPQFVDPAADFHLQAGSPCIDKGYNGAVPEWLATDFEGDPRIYNDTVDMGADEYVPETEPVTVTVDIKPDTLNLRSEGKWITVYIELPEGYDVNDIDIGTIMLEDLIPAEDSPTNVGDYDNDGIPDLMVKFDRQEVIGELDWEWGTIYSDELTINLNLDDGTAAEGSDTIKVLAKEDKGKGKGKK